MQWQTLQAKVRLLPEGAAESAADALQSNRIKLKESEMRIKSLSIVVIAIAAVCFSGVVAVRAGHAECPRATDVICVDVCFEHRDTAGTVARKTKNFNFRVMQQVLSARLPHTVAVSAFVYGGCRNLSWEISG